MLDNRQYHRSFIILKTQDSGFSLDDRKEAAGYCKMEIRNNQGKFMLYVQDMKPASPRQGIYDVMLLSSRDEVAPVKLTSIQVPDSGRGEYEIAFDPDDVRETGTPIDQFHAFAIVYRPLGEGHALQYPLIGYSDKRVEMNWSGAVTEKLERFYGQKAPGRYAGPGPESKETPQEGGLLSVSWRTHGKKKAASGSDIGTVSDEKNSSGAKEISGGDGRQSESTYSGRESPEAIASAHREAARKEAEQEKTARKKAEQEEAARKKAEQEEASLEFPHFDPPDIRYIYDRTEEQDTETDLSEESLPDKDILEEDTLDGNASEEAPDENSLYDRDTDINSPDTNGTEETGYAENVPYDNIMQEPMPPSNPAGSYPEGRSYWDQTKDYFNQLFQNNARVCPFDGIPETEWVRVENPNPSPYSCYGMTDYGGNGAADHYLVGLARHRGKVRYVIYGVPGIYSMVPPLSMQGFSGWLPVKNGYGAGYWLLYIDAISGNVAYPY